MIKGLGTDIIEIDRIRDSVARHGAHFIDKIFTQAEQDYCTRYNDPLPNYAGRFAAKEAVVKALGTGFGKDIACLDVEIINDRHGKPSVCLSSRCSAELGDPKILVSISHCRLYATATAIWVV